MMRVRGQATIEFVILLSASMLLFGVIFFNAQESLLSAATLREQSSLHNETAKVARAAKDLVYATDQRFVLLNRVPGLDRLHFETKGQSLSFSNATQSWNYRLDQPIAESTGSVTYPAFLLRVVNDQLVVESWPFFVEPQSMVLSLQKGQSHALSMRLQNVSNEPISIQLEFPSFNGISFSILENPIVLPAYHATTIDINIEPESVVTGSFIGNLEIDSNLGSSSPLSIPVQLSILDESPILFYPGFVTIAGDPSESFSEDVTLCNASQVTMSDVTFSVSAILSDEVDTPSSVSSFEAGCINLSLTGTLPAEADANVSGYLTVSATGASNALQINLQTGNG